MVSGCYFLRFRSMLQGIEVRKKVLFFISDADLFSDVIPVVGNR